MQSKSLSQSGLLLERFQWQMPFCLLAPKPTEDDSVRGKVTTWKGKSKSQKELVEKIDLTGLQDWNLDDQKEA